jgi:hypothetical protein
MVAIKGGALCLGVLDGGRRWQGSPHVGGDRRAHDGGQPAGVRPADVAPGVQLLPAVPADGLQHLSPQLAGNAGSRCFPAQVTCTPV